MFFGTLVPRSGTLSTEEFPHHDLLAFKRKEARKIASALPAGCRVIGAVDDSYIIPIKGVPYWQRHFHLAFFSNADAKTIKVAIKGKFLASDVIARPVKMVPFEKGTEDDLASYLYKMSFRSASKYLAVPKNGYRKPYQNTKSQKLPKEAKEVLYNNLALHKVTDALVLIGFKRARSTDPCACNLSILK